MKIAITGHRPNKLGDDYNYSSQWVLNIASEIQRILLLYKPSMVYIGMAQGIDQIVALVCIRNGIPFTAAVPFKGQELAWPLSAQIRYHNILKQAVEVVIVSDGAYAPYKMQVRNEWMVDKLKESDDRLLAVWDKSPGGTANCVKYTVEQNKQIIYIDPNNYR